MRFDRLLVGDLLVCLRFFSRLPMPDVGRDAAGFSRFPDAVRMLPIAGAALGGLAALALGLASALGLPPSIAAALAIGTLVLLTGALHEDGLADCADGLGGGGTRERKLEIMRDSRIGAYGAIAIALGLYLRIESLAAVAATSMALAGATLIAAAAVSRTAALVPSLVLPAARADGSGHAAGRPSPRSFGIAVSIAILLAFLPVPAGADPRAAVMGLAAAGAVALGATWLADRQIGGHTGDVAGAAQQLAELAFLLALAAR